MGEVVKSMDKFNWLQYLNNYSDLRAAGIKDQQGAYRHYLKYGKKECRTDQVIQNDNNKLANFGIIINSCKKFYNLYIPRILNQLLLNNFPVDNIVVVVGQSDKNEDSQYNGIKIINVTYTGLNFSSMIHMVENIDFYLNKNLKTWLVLPDTIEVTKNFYNLISPYVNKMEEQDLPCVPLTDNNHIASMDIGLLNIDYIYKLKDFFLDKKLESYDIKSLLELKERLVHVEDLILGMKVNSIISRPTFFICDNKDDVLTYEIINKDSSNAPRLCKRIINKIGFTKYQRTYCNNIDSNGNIVTQLGIID